MTVIPAYWQMVATGCVLLIAVVINYQLARDKGKA
jgi:ribose/xylose/arabinose/galactoside ABC-type transport system permease subunit